MNHTQTDVQQTDDRRNRLAETTLELLAFDTQNPPGEDGVFEVRVDDAVVFDVDETEYDLRTII